MIFAGQSRDQLRETYRAAWRRYKQQHTLSPLDKQVVAVISEHPEYHVIVESAAADLANYSPRSGQLNPWLHMGLHLAIREQVATNRPAGITEVHAKLARKAGGAHEAEHRMLEVLAEQLWEAQRGGKAPDENAYLERLTAASPEASSPKAFPRPDLGAAKCEPVPTSERPRAAARKARTTLDGACLRFPEWVFPKPSSPPSLARWRPC